MSFTDKKNIKLRLRSLNDQRASRIRKLIDRGLIESAVDIPEHAIPIDFDNSTKAELCIAPTYYEDIEYECIDCGTHETWRAETQQYYFETLKSPAHRRAVRCADCQGKRKRSIRKTQD